MFRHVGGLTTQPSSGRRCVAGGDVLQYHDTRAVIPLYADPAWRVDQVHAACVFHIKSLVGEGEPDGSVVHGHLDTNGENGTSGTRQTFLSMARILKKKQPFDPVG